MYFYHHSVIIISVFKDQNSSIISDFMGNGIHSERQYRELVEQEIRDKGYAHTQRRGLNDHLNEQSYRRGNGIHTARN